MPTPEMIELRTRLENDLAMTIVSELLASSARGFYIVLASEVEGLQLDGNLGGMTHPAVSSWLRPEIGDRWRGNGPGMLLVDGENCSPERFTAKAIHETAHIATSIELFSAPSQAVNTALTGLVATPPRSWPAHRSAARWSGHGFDFIRAVFHLGYRMTARGHTIFPDLLMNWPGYGYASGWKAYYEALESELDSREFEAISGIAKSPCPKGFLELWLADIGTDCVPVNNSGSVPECSV